MENAFNPPYTAPFDSSAAVGTPFTFSYLFNYSGAVDFLSSSPNIGDYRLYGADAGATVAFGNYTFTPSPISFGDFVTYDNYQGTTSDSIELDTSGGTATGFTVPVGQINTGVRVFNQVGLLSSKALPPLSTFSAIDLSKADFVAGVVSNGQSSRVIGSVSSINAVFVAPVPEASTTVSLGVMLGLGGLVLAVRARRRSRV